MRHGKKINHLGRKVGHRKALLKNMAAALIKHKRINTTLAKAKALRRYIEPLLTKGKNDTMHSRRVVFSYLQDKEATSEVFGDIAAKIADRPGGYCRIIKTGFRLGDAAETAMIELVDYNDVMVSASQSSGKAKTGKKRTRRSKAASKAGTTAAAPAVKSDEEE